MRAHSSDLLNQFSENPCIKVLGLGGAGCNTINRLSWLKIPGIELCAANTDAQVLNTCLSETKISLGDGFTRGLGSGGDPDVGRSAAEESFRELSIWMKGSDLLFLTAGMGGGTGSGAIEIAARIAHSLGILTVSVVTLPFSFESGVRSRNAIEAAARLRPFTDTLITIPNDRLVALAEPGTTLSKAFALADDLLVKAIQGISGLIQSGGLLNLDISHVLRLMKQQGGCYISTGTGIGEDKINKAMADALRHPLLEDIPWQNAGGMIVKFTGSLTLAEIQDAVEDLRAQSSQGLEIITAVGDNSLISDVDQAQVMILVTGLGGVDVEKEFAPEQPWSLSNENIEKAIPISGNFPESGFTPSDPIPDELDVPAFLRRGYNQFIPAAIIDQANG